MIKPKNGKINFKFIILVYIVLVKNVYRFIRIYLPE
jgi:hypothetical protein